MSTRCQIEVIGSEHTKLYRHSDGYPESKHGVIAEIKPFLKKFANGRGEDPAYLIARLCQHLTNKADRSRRKSAKESNFDYEPNLHIGYGIDSEYHSDIEYLYRIHEPSRTIDVLEVNFWDGKNEMKLTPNNSKCINTVNF